MHTITDIQERFRVSRETVLSWITAGQLSAFDAAPANSKRKFYRVSEASLLAFEAARSAGPTRPATIPRKVGKIRQFV